MGDEASDLRWGLTLSRRQRGLQAVNRIFARIYHHVEVLSPSRLPEKGAAILVCNHTSGLDPQLIQSSCNRLITWMMAREYYASPLLKGILDTVGVIPVSRGARDTAATRAAFRALDDGKVLGIFPEGKIETGNEILPFQTGVGLLALKSGAPVYPAYLDGTQRGLEMAESFTRRQEAVLTFGPPLQFSRDRTPEGGMDAVTKQIEEAVASLRQHIHKS